MRGSVSFFSSSVCWDFGSRTSLPRWSMGVTTMKMISSTSTTSTRGVTLISFLTPLPEPPPIAMATIPSGGRFGLGGDDAAMRPEALRDDVEELVRGLRDVDRARVDPPGEEVERHDGRDGDEQA